MNKLLGLLVLLAGTAHAQYIISPSDPGHTDGSIAPLAGLPEVYSGGQLFQVDWTRVEATNGTTLVGGFSYLGFLEAAVWLNGINNPATNLNGLISGGTGNGLIGAYAIDAQGDIWGIDRLYLPGPAPQNYKLTPAAAAPEIGADSAMSMVTLLLGALAVMRGKELHTALRQ